MKLKYYFLPVALLFVGAGCEQNQVTMVNQDAAQPSKIAEKVEQKNVVSEPTLMNLLGSVAVSIPRGMNVWQRESITQAGERGQSTDIMPSETYALLTNGVFEGELPPPFVSVAIYNNGKKLSPEEWAKMNKGDSSYGAKTGSVKKETLGGQSAISYTSSEMYYAKYHIAVTEDRAFVIVVTENYSDLAQSQTLNDLKQIIEKISIGHSVASTLSAGASQNGRIVATSPDKNFVLRVVGNDCTWKAEITRAKKNAKEFGLRYDLSMINPNPGSDFESSDLGSVIVRSIQEDKKAEKDSYNEVFRTSSNVVRAVLVQQPPCVMSIMEK